MTILPYGGTSGHSGSDTSKERAIKADREGTTNDRQKRVMFYLIMYDVKGLTWKELSTITNWHHGTASGTLSILHKAGKISRLVERRNGCKIYVLPEYVEGRKVEPHGGKRSSRFELIREIRAFANDYAYTIQGRDAVLVEDLIAFLDIPDRVKVK